MFVFVGTARALRVGQRRGLSRLISRQQQGRSSSWKGHGAAAAALATTACCAMSGTSESQGVVKDPREIWSGVLDKTTTGVGRLPAGSNGRGVVVAVLDTGVDPAAPGLATTPHGQPKMIDVIDATGAGDVSLMKCTAEDGWVSNPATGRKLKLDATQWGHKNPSDGVWMLGAKSAATFWPAAVLDRRAREHSRETDAMQRKWIAKARAAREDARGDATKDVAELEARLCELQKAAKMHAPTRSNIAPLLDVICWDEPVNKGSTVRRTVVVDTTADLKDVKVLTDFGESVRLGEPLSSRLASFGDKDLLTYSVSQYENDVVCLVTCAGDHGTHVASIVGAYEPGESSEKSGLAPGAQIMSIKIGDARLGSMETGAGLARALIAAKRSKVDVLNLSYGEAATLCDSGRFMGLANELVNDSGAIFLASAGNNGPALSTVGAPGGTTRSIISVGAYVNPNMCKDLYAMRTPPASTTDPEHGGLMYSFSSRGPAPDGGTGVCVVAPGGAVASVPPYTLQPQRLMHGTSMSSPNAAGSVACLVGALKAKEVPYSPASLRRAVEATALKLPGMDSTDQGAGLLAVDAAFSALKEAPLQDTDVRYIVNVNERSIGALYPAAPAARGIYLREPFETEDPSEISVSVTPRFQNDTERNNMDKATFSRSVRLESDAEWVTVGERLVLNHGGKAFNCLVDPTKAPLHPGQGPACAQVVGYDADLPDSLPLFTVPIALVKPLVATRASLSVFEEEKFDAGDIKRTFVVPPRGATSATLTLRAAPSSSASAADGLGKRLVHVSTVQLSPQESYADIGHAHKRVWVGDGDSVVIELASLAPERTLELCVSQDWNSLQGCALSCDVEFKTSGAANDAPVVLRGTRSLAKIDLAAPSWVSTGTTIGAPVAKLKRWRRPLRPSTSAITLLPDAARDEWTQGRRYYDLVLEYSWTQPAGATDAVTLRFAGDELVYDAPTDGQHAKICDSRGKVMAWRDARVFGEAKGFDAGSKYTAQLTVRHDDLAKLERLRDAECWVEMSMTKELQAGVYATRQGAYMSEKSNKFKELKLKPGELNRCAFLTPPAESDLPKDAAVGDVLVGTISYARSPSYTAGASRRAAQSLTYHVPPRSQKTAEKEKKAEEKALNNKKNKTSTTEVGVLQPGIVEVLAVGTKEQKSARDAALAAMADATFDKQLEILNGESGLALDTAAHAALAAHLASLRSGKLLAVRLCELDYAAKINSAKYKARKDSGESSFALDAEADAAHVSRAASAVRAALDETAIAVNAAKRDVDANLVFNATVPAEDEKKKQEGDKAALLTALRWQTEARLATASKPNATAEQLETLATSIAELGQWVDTNKGPFSDARLRSELDSLNNRPGRALSVLSTWLETKKSKSSAHDDDLKDAAAMRSALYEKLGWDLWAKAELKKLKDDIPNPKIS